MAEYAYGTSYTPLMFPESEWEHDLQGMQSASMNLIRIGDCHGSWDRFEPRPGEVRLDVLERFYKAAAKHGLKILLSTGASSPPLWLASQHPDVVILSSSGERYPLAASYHWACVHNPDYRNAAESYLTKIASFAASQPNHFGWQITNEIGFPFMPARERGELGLYCYCEHCQADFRNWLQIKYQNLDALTHAWSWSTTSFVYNNWAEISAPESMPSSWSGVTRWLDWRQFTMQGFVTFTAWQHALIRRYDPLHPTSINTFNFKGFDRFGVFMGVDQWQLAQHVDHIGYDLYPGSGNKLKSRPEHNSIFLDHGRSVAQSTGRDFWVHEVESGPIGGWIMGPEHNTNASDIFNNVIETLGHNAKVCLFMPWREWGYQPLRWGALVDLQGQSTPRLDAASQLGKFIRAESDFLLQAKPPAAEVALVESKPNAIFFRGVDQEEILFEAQRGAYRVFWEQGLGVDFITPAQFDLDYLRKYRIVVLPLMGLLSLDEAQALEAYVAQGGILIGQARCATLDERGWYHMSLPIPPIGAIFGLQSVLADTLDGQTIDFDGQVYRPWLNRDVITPTPKTEILAHFSDGQPAITAHQHGAGFGIYVATQADAGHLHGDGGLLSSLVRSLTARLGITPVLKLETDLNRAGGIDAHLLEYGKKSLILFSNYAAHACAASIRLGLRDRQVLNVKQRLLNPESLSFSIQGDSLEPCLTIHVQFQPKEVKAIQVDWQ